MTMPPSAGDSTTCGAERRTRAARWRRRRPRPRAGAAAPARTADSRGCAVRRSAGNVLRAGADAAEKIENSIGWSQRTSHTVCMPVHPRGVLPNPRRPGTVLATVQPWSIKSCVRQRFVGGLFAVAVAGFGTPLSVFAQVPVPPRQRAAGAAPDRRRGRRAGAREQPRHPGRADHAAGRGPERRSGARRVVAVASTPRCRAAAPRRRTTASCRAARGRRPATPAS